MNLAPDLLALARAAGHDGGRGAVLTLAALLAEAAPHEHGEVALVRGEEVEHFRFPGDRDPLAAPDLVRHVATRPDALRIDHEGEAEPYPRTLERMRAQGIRSLIALPTGMAGGPPGAVVLGRSYGWAFAGTSLHRLSPLAAMAGLALGLSLELSEQPSDTRERVRHLEGELETVRRALNGERLAREKAQARVRELEARGRRDRSRT